MHYSDYRECMRVLLTVSLPIHFAGSDLKTNSMHQQTTSRKR